MEMKFAEVNGKLKEVVIMTMEEYEFDRNLMKLVGRADLIEELEKEAEKDGYAQQIRGEYLRNLKGQIGLAVTEVQEATGNITLRNAVENLLDELYRVGLADK